MDPPEILDPERIDSTRGSQSGVLGVVERAFHGRVVRTEGARIEVGGPAGPVVVLPTPLITLVMFRGIRQPLPQDAAQALAFLSGVADGSLVVVEERASPTLRRSHLVRVRDGQLAALEDTTNDRAEVPQGAVQIVSFPTGLREATRDERRFIQRAMGGFVGRLKRRIVEAIFERTVGVVERAVANAGNDVAPSDDGRRTLGPK